MVFDNTGSYGMIASDIIDGLDKVWIKVEKNRQLTESEQI